MEIIKSIERIPKTRMHQLINILWSLLFLIATLLIAMGLASCSKDEPTQDPTPLQGSGEVTGTVKDENGNPYPSTLITVSNGAEKTSKATNSDGVYKITTKDIGSYTIEIELPLSTELVGNPSTTVNVEANQTVTADFTVQPQPVEAHLNFGNVQLLEEIVNKDGNTPTDPNETLFAKNIFDDPIGQLNEIRAPDGHQLILSEFQMAKGNLLVHCNGNSSTVEISLEGMIPNGTYTFWLAYMKRKVSVGQSIDFANDFVNQTNPPIGPSDESGNVVVADVDGKINLRLEHSTCILTDEVGLVIPVLYHLNGKTFGGGHQPDAEEMVQLLVYFQ